MQAQATQSVTRVLLPGSASALLQLVQNTHPPALLCHNLPPNTQATSTASSTHGLRCRGKNRPEELMWHDLLHCTFTHIVHLIVHTQLCQVHLLERNHTPLSNSKGLLHKQVGVCPANAFGTFICQLSHKDPIHMFPAGSPATPPATTSYACTGRASAVNRAPPQHFCHTNTKWLQIPTVSCLYPFGALLYSWIFAMPSLLQPLYSGLIYLVLYLQNYFVYFSLLQCLLCSTKLHLNI